MKPAVAVVGGGATGLSLALYLQQAGAAVTVYDAAPQPGGLSVAATFPEFSWDRFYHVIAPQDRALLDLLTQLGLADEVRWTPSRQGIFLDQAVRPLNGPLDLLRLPGLSLYDKFRLGMLVLHGRRDVDPRILDEQTSAEWLRQHCGNRNYDRLWRYLLRAKLGDAAGTTSARFIHATLRRLGAARKQTGGGERFGYVRGGYRTVLQRLVEQLRDNGAELMAGTAVQAVRHDQATGKVQVQTAAGERSFDRAALTLPNPQLAAVAKDLSLLDHTRLSRTPYLGVLCTVVVGRAQLSPNYILNLCDDRLELTGIIEMSNIVDQGSLAGRTLVYLPRYATADSAVFAQDDAAIAATALRDLATVFPATRDGWLLHTAVHRARLIQPIPLAGGQPLAPPRVLVPGAVFCVSNAQLPTCVLNNNDCVAMARAAVADVLG